MRLENINKVRLLAIISAFVFIPLQLCLGDEILSITPHSSTCHGENDGKIEITTKQKNSNISLQVYSDSTFQNLLFDRLISDEVTFIENLKAQEYFIKYSINGTEITKNIVISEPDELEPGVIQIEQGLDNIQDTDAVLMAAPKGGTEPYTYSWSYNTGEQKLQKATNLGMGTYFCEINDANGCGPVRSTIFFNHITYPELIKN
jgi:hypothetical protein